MARDLLIEIGTEELPPKSLATLATSFGASICQSLQDAKLSFAASELFATPRRLAIRIKDLQEQQPDQRVEKLGPAVLSAFDANGKPSQAAIGFARSHGVDVEQLQRVQTDKGERLAFCCTIAGQSTRQLLPAFIETALASLPIPKRMRWGAHKAEFVRPVHWIVLLYGDAVIEADIMGIATGNLSRGHRFHAPDPFPVTVANYVDKLLERKVVASFSERRSMIARQVAAEAKAINGTAVIDEALLDEVTALVEWPVALTGNFEKRFLEVPAQALISSMKEHQKYFHVLDADGNLLPNFITITNIESRERAKVIDGNERVIRPRLSDADFFFRTDKKKSLEQRCDQLKTIIFQQQLGTLYDKTRRVANLAVHIAGLIGSDERLAERAGLLCKSDLVSEMVFEFTDLQGIMGYHYALHDGEPEEVARALYEQYLPKGADDALPQTMTGCALALADRIDTLIGIFGIGEQPSGNKDPFALRRAALGILNIILDKSLDIDLHNLFSFAYRQHSRLTADNAVRQALDYTMERFRAHYQAQGIPTEIYLAVAARNISNPLDFDRRIRAVHEFSKRTEAAALAAANKRVANLLAKQEGQQATPAINHDLLQEAAEKALVTSFNNLTVQLQAAIATSNYPEVLSVLALLKPEIDRFFDSVMVMVEDDGLRQNRLAILHMLRSNFLHVADISLLATK